MKYGYLFYRKPLRPKKKERPMNMGDPIQALAAINLFREMGIPEEDIIPVDRYDTAYYDGEEVILSYNCADNFEYHCYPTAYFPFATQIKPLIISFHIDRQMREDEVEFLYNSGPIGCRDESTLIFINEKLHGGGADTYLSGCLTITFPLREKTSQQNKVFLIDCPSGLLDNIPSKLREGSITLSNIIKFTSVSDSNRITREEAENFHQVSYEQLYRLRDEAKLVITSRLHIATPCLAMGIPVILAKDNAFDVRFGFIDKFLPLYTKERYHEIDWNPVPQDIEREKALVKECFFSSVRAVAARTMVSNMYQARQRQVKYSYGMDIVLSMVPLPKDKPCRYAIWGVCLHATYLLHEEIVNTLPQAKLVNLIDTYATGKAIDIDIIHPDKIASLEDDVIIFITAPAAHKPAKDLLLNTKRPFVLIYDIDANTEVYNF